MLGVFLSEINYSFYDVDVVKLRTKVRTPPQLGEVCYCAFVFVIWVFSGGVVALNYSLAYCLSIGLCHENSNKDKLTILY